MRSLIKNLIVFGLIVTITILGLSCSKKQISVDKRVRNISNHRTLPSGLQLWIEKGANVSQQEIAAMESGMEECFSRARPYGYTYPLDLSNYVIAVFADTEFRNGAWSYSIPTPPEYVGTIYDHEGILWIAGQYLNNRTDQNIMVLPDYDDNNLEVLSRTAGYEVEHVVLRYSDPAKYLRTMVHTPETPHPLF